MGIYMVFSENMCYNQSNQTNSEMREIMPLPLKPGYNFNVDRQIKNADYEMNSMEIYRDYYGISYTVSGNRKFITPHIIGILHAGCIGMTAKDVYHRTSYISLEPYERFVIKFTYAVARRLIYIIGQETFDELYKCPVYHFTESVQEKLFGIFCDMHNEFTHYNECSDLILEGMLHNLLVTVMRERLPFYSDNVLLSKEDHTIINAMHYIEGHFLENPSLEELAKNVNLSPSYFSKLFKKSMGSTYSTYLNCIKIEHARVLLVNTNLSVGEIAGLCGFSNGNYFCDVLKKYDKISPKDFRKQYRAQAQSIRF